MDFIIGWFISIGFITTIIAGTAGIALILRLMLDYIWRTFTDITAFASVCQEARKQGKSVWKKKNN
jgi:hypothetical protein